MKIGRKLPIFVVNRHIQRIVKGVEEIKIRTFRYVLDYFVEIGECI